MIRSQVTVQPDKEQQILVPNLENDKKRVQEILSGEEIHFKTFFEEYFPRLYRFANERLSGDHEATREVVQNTLSKVLLNLSKFRGDSTLFTWMCSICRNEIFDFLKKQSKYQNVIVLKPDISDVDLCAQTSPGISPEQPDDAYQRDQVTKRIHLALDQLPANYGNVLEWKYIDGLSVKQIAQRLGQSHAATQSILFRARLAFQDIHRKLVRA